MTTQEVLGTISQMKERIETLRKAFNKKDNFWVTQSIDIMERELDSIKDQVNQRPQSTVP